MNLLDTLQVTELSTPVNRSSEQYVRGTHHYCRNKPQGFTALCPTASPGVLPKEKWMRLICVWGNPSTSFDTHLFWSVVPCDCIQEDCTGPAPGQQAGSMRCSRGGWWRCTRRPCGLGSPSPRAESSLSFESLKKKKSTFAAGKDFRGEVGQAGLFQGRKRWGWAGCTTVPCPHLLGRLGGCSPHFLEYGKLLSSGSVEPLCTEKCKAKRWRGLVEWYLTAPGCLRLLMAVCKLRRCRSDRKACVSEIPPMERPRCYLGQ